MRVGVQFSGTVPAGTSHRWFTYDWPPDWHVVWTVVPTTAGPGAPQIEWDVAVQRASASAVTYWITVRNLSAAPVDIESRYEVMN
jgi:hypothetical protein